MSAARGILIGVGLGLVAWGAIWWLTVLVVDGIADGVVW